MSIYTGKTVSDAVKNGLKQLHITRSAAKVKVIQSGRKGFLGIGRRNAKVQINKINTKENAQSTNHRKQQKVAKSMTNRQERDHKKASQKFTIKQVKPKPIKLNHRHNQVKVTKPQRSRHLDRKQQNHEAIRKLENYLGSVIRQLGISATMKAAFQNSKQVRINFSTNKEGLLIGKHGLTINALQELSKIFLNRLGIYHIRVELDTADYRQRRMDILGRLAKKTAREAVANGKPVYLDPMPSFERKKIHRTLEDSDHVMTYSAGREPYRAVVVAPK